MSLTAVPAYFLARRLLTPGLSLGGRGARRAAAVDALHRDADDRERVLSAVRARVTRPRADARAADRAAPAAAARDVRRLLRDARAGDRALRRRSRRAGAARADRARPAARGCGATRRSTAIAGGAAVLALLGTVARGRSPLSLLGAYRAATGSDYSVSEVAHYLLWHVAELDLYLGVIGVAALIAMWLAPRTLTPAARAFVAATLPITLLLVAEVAVFASRQSGRIEERNDFYVAPFAIIALLGLASRDAVVPVARRTRVIAAVIAGVAAARRAVRALRQHLGRLGHARAAALVVAAGSGDPLRAAALRGARGRARGRRGVRLRPVALCACPADPARRLLRARVDRRRERPARDPAGIGGRALRRHPRSAPRLDRPAGRP